MWTPWIPWLGAPVPTLKSSPSPSASIARTSARGVRSSSRRETTDARSCPDRARSSHAPSPRRSPAPASRLAAAAQAPKKSTSAARCRRTRAAAPTASTPRVSRSGNANAFGMTPTTVIGFPSTRTTRPIAASGPPNRSCDRRMLGRPFTVRPVAHRSAHSWLVTLARFGESDETIGIRPRQRLQQHPVCDAIRPAHGIHPAGGGTAAGRLSLTRALKSGMAKSRVITVAPSGPRSSCEPAASSHVEKRARRWRVPSRHVWVERSQ